MHTMFSFHSCTATSKEKQKLIGNWSFRFLYVIIFYPKLNALLYVHSDSILCICYALFCLWHMTNVAIITVSQG